jgi:hypothetical protein
MNPRLLIIAAAALLLTSANAQAQFGGAAIFEPEIDIVNSGQILDAQATVSHDRKYVTMTMRPQSSQLLSLQTFTFQTAAGVPLPGGVIGGVNPVIAAPIGVTNTIPTAVNPSRAVVPGHGGAILLTRGVTPLVLK